MKTLSRLFGAVLCLPIAGLLVAIFVEYADRSGNPLAYWLAFLGLILILGVIGGTWVLLRIVGMVFADRQRERGAWQETTAISFAAATEITSAVSDGVRLGTDQNGNRYYMLPGGGLQPANELTEAEANYMARLQTGQTV